MNIENLKTNLPEKEQKKEEFNIGDRIKVTIGDEERFGEIDVLPPNLPEGTIGVKFDDGKREAVSEKDVEKITEEEVPEEEKEDDEEYN